MKKVVVCFVLVFVILFSGYVNALCPTINQTIMTLYSQNNSHGVRFPDQGQIDICYNTVFGQQYTGTNANQLITNCAEPIVFLSYEKNAHAASDDTSGYGVRVCYGNLSCIAMTTLADCDGWGGKIIVSLSNTTNAHISAGDYPYYPVKMCCRNGVPATAPTAYWTDMSNREISLAANGTNVKMAVNPSVPAGSRYTIEKRNGNNWNTVISTTSNTWTTNGDGIYRFTVDGVGVVSSNLSVGTGILDVDFVSPDCGSDFNISQPVQVIVNASYSDNTVTGTLYFGDGTSAPINNNGMNTFNHAYSTSGTKKMIANLTDAQHHVATQVRNIIVVNTSASARYVASCIASPKNAEILNTNIVKFNASTTRAFNFNPSSGKTPISLDALNFTWKLKDIGSTYMTILFSNDTIIKTHSTQGRVANSPGDNLARGYNFTYRFPTSGENWAQLSVDFRS